MTETFEFKNLQYAFTAYLRDPQNNPPPTEVEPRRLAVYRELIFNNLESLLASTYPKLKRILTEDRWQTLIADFLATHRSQTPLFPQLPSEFLKFLTIKPVPEELPFLYELAHYEWVELALAIDNQTLDLTGIDRTGDLLQGRPLLSPLAWPLAYQFPVQLLDFDYQPREPPAEMTYLVGYRDIQDKVHFIQLNAISARLFRKLSETQLNGQTILAEITQELAHPKPEIVVAGGLQTLQEWLKLDIILGVQKVELTPVNADDVTRSPI